MKTLESRHRVQQHRCLRIVYCGIQITTELGAQGFRNAEACKFLLRTIKFCVPCCQVLCVFPIPNHNLGWHFVSGSPPSCSYHTEHHGRNHERGWHMSWGFQARGGPGISQGRWLGESNLRDEIVVPPVEKRVLSSFRAQKIKNRSRSCLTAFAPFFDVGCHPHVEKNIGGLLDQVHRFYAPSSRQQFVVMLVCVCAYCCLHSVVVSFGGWWVDRLISWSVANCSVACKPDDAPAMMPMYKRVLLRIGTPHRS